MAKKVCTYKWVPGITVEKKIFFDYIPAPQKIPQPRAPLLFSQQLLYLAKNINFCQSFFFNDLV